jgi:deoxyribonuclease V
MRRRTDPDWPGLVEQWKQTQLDLRQRLLVEPLTPLPRFIAGADAAFSADKSTVFAAAVVYDRVEQRIVEIRLASGPAEVPYVPGFLSFREGPTLLQAIRKLQHPFGAILFDGQGYAHPRRCGIATHLGIELNITAVGVGKSRLIGTFTPPPSAAGAFSPLVDGDEEIGCVLRTRQAVSPLFISIGHRIDLPSARELVLACCAGCRIPEPTRQADIEVGRAKHASPAAANEASPRRVCPIIRANRKVFLPRQLSF